MTSSSQPQQAAVSSASKKTSSGASAGRGLDEWRNRKREIREARVENGKKLQVKLRELRAKGLLQHRKSQTLSQASGVGELF